MAKRAVRKKKRKAKSKGGAGKRKGSKFERKICNALSRFIDPKSSETLFWRSAMSGGRATVRHKKGVKDTTQSGDISCIDPKGAWLTEHFFIECKFYRDLDIKGGLLTGRGRLAKFWRTARKEAKKHHKFVWLIAKENNTQTIMLLSNKGLHTLNTFKPIEVEHKLWSQVLSAHVFHFDSVMKS